MPTATAEALKKGPGSKRPVQAMYDELQQLGGDDAGPAEVNKKRIAAQQAARGGKVAQPAKNAKKRQIVESSEDDELDLPSEEISSQFSDDDEYSE